jgi:hypothetical protein
MITHKSIGYSGRLGNQMFQYAVLKAINLELGYDICLPYHQKIKHDGVYDLTHNQWIAYRLDLLDCFNITTPIQEISLSNIFNETSFEYDHKIFSIQDNTSIEGYFQSYKYFEKYQEQIKKEFTFKPHIFEKCKNILSKYLNPISIHIRRGDYINHPSYWTVTPEYIIEALKILQQDEATYIIFSDDKKWCETVFGEGFIFSEGENQFEDLCLMSLCKHNIIANSSYSWWGAYLNSNKDKKIIAPSQWFTDGRSLKDLYPNNWIII